MNHTPLKSNIERQSNPFLIANVLEKIFPNLDYASLKSSRKVCYLWNLLSAPFLSRRSKITIEGPFWDERGSAFLQTIEDAASHRSKLFPVSSISYSFQHNGFSNRTAFFFKNYGFGITSLTLHIFPLQPSATTDITQRFFQIFSLMLSRDCPNVTHLTMNHLENLELSKISQNLGGTLVVLGGKVKFLRLCFISNNAANHPNICNFVQRLLAMAPALQELEFEATFMHGTDVASITFFETLANSKVNDKALSECLKCLSLDVGTLEPATLRILTEMQFSQLQSLKVNTSLTSPGHIASFHAFLSSVSPTLERLEIFGAISQKYNHANRNLRFNEKSNLDLPLLPKLKDFHHENFENVRLGGLEFLRQLPNVQNIVIKDSQPSLGDIMLCPQLTLFSTLFNNCSPLNKNRSKKQLLTTAPQPQVSSLVVDALYLPSSENLSSTSKILFSFPNLLNLELSVSLAFKNVYIGEVLSILSKSSIKRLRIKFYQSTELVVDAVSKSFGNALEKIGNFQELQRLELSLEDMQPMPSYDLSCSVIQQILKSEKLKFIYLKGFGFEKETEENCKGLLNDKLLHWKMEEAAPAPPWDYCSY